jgi:hypothetical protein
MRAILSEAAQVGGHMADGSIDIDIGPQATQRHETNWIRTLPGTGWFSLLRPYGPLQHWIDKVRKPGNPEIIT